jgi:hypothetical protein
MADLVGKRISLSFVLIMIFCVKTFILTGFSKIDSGFLMLKVACLFLSNMFIIASLDARFFEGICLLAIELMIASYLS